MIFKSLSLKGINCSNNLLKEIDLNNVVNLEFLECNKNLLSNIDVSFLENLQILNCSGNQLTELDISQLIRLFELDCSKNQLKQIDISPLPQLTNFNCTYNPIEALYIKNGVYNMTSCPFSPPFPCYKYQVFDSVPNLKYICADAEEIDGFKTAAINNGYPDITINSLCSSTLGGTFSLIVGQVKLDIHNNGCNESDTAYPNLKVKISNDIDSTYIISGSDGNFSAYLNPGTYIFEPILNHLKYFEASPISSTLTLPDTVSPIFCITPKGDFNDLSVNIIPITAARPGFSDAQYKVVFKNQGTTTQSGTVTFNFDENKMNVIGSSPIADQSNNGQLGFDFSNLAPFESRSVIVTMRINSPADNTPVHVGDELEFSANINGQPDETPEDNTALLNQKVIGSFDPNDKTCLEGDIITPDKVGKRVNYLIRFENTGTAPAENVLITDYIDTTVFDINTLLMTDASHTCHTQISKGNKVQFIFSDIQLPYTEPDKHGFVAFSIQLKKYLQIGDSIKNHADIYFDYNLPITTNEAVS
ncbi:MAG: leucine-rich repeat domain-containing protein, partial [Chitinophagales bacterium]|nr:leucine-rich repeat domain-containing protein [Chitinophagales bacterium]